MEIAPLSAHDAERAATLWRAADLTRPWNDPVADFQRALGSATSTVLGTCDDGELVGTVMAGYDGHRGWLYYLAVAKSHQGRGLGRELTRSAEEWLVQLGAVKVQLMVRDTNAAVLAFYQHLGYETSEVAVLGRWMTNERDAEAVASTLRTSSDGPTGQ